VKNMQKWVSKIRIILTVVMGICPAILFANQTLLNRADSLYNQKKFSEAREVYFQLYQQGFASPATLLKMALVHEGLGETGQALYFLSAYYRETEDAKAYEKILTLANARGVKGYELSEWEKLTIWVNNRITIYLPIALGLAIFFMSIMIYNSKRANTSAKFAA
jgi:membrane associated rhomboid family serine protease